MKRIKLFEAFNNTDKVEKLNLVVFSWAIEKFIQKNDLVIDTTRHTEFTRLRIVNKNLNNILYFTYNPDLRVGIYCATTFLAYLKKMKLAEGVKQSPIVYQLYDPLYFYEIVAKVLKQVIKKIFVDDKD